MGHRQPCPAGPALRSSPGRRGFLLPAGRSGRPDEATPGGPFQAPAAGTNSPVSSSTSTAGPARRALLGASAPGLAGAAAAAQGAGQARPNSGAYTASTRAVQGLVKAAALAYGTRGIRVNAILPGTTDTAFVRPPGIPDAAWAQFRKAYGPLNIEGLERLAEPEEIARAILAPTSDDFAYQSGASVPVDGGATAGRRMVMPPTS
ncbi:SDR family NAD(P)-dependent oxidoreductase [Kitasatospora sp. NPDC101235]|uniref:SDR family NAD(P)-dependent oxidoreductase n=1 Tax=Kitasatospora sp. NPDC101235 TaxID=3364101 RepID=UPI00382DAF16